MKTIAICLVVGLPPVPVVISDWSEVGQGAEDRIEVREIWDPACMMAVPELEGIDDPDEFERAAMEWLCVQEGYVAAEIAADHGRELVGWRHEEVDNTPYGMTVVILGKRLPLHGCGILAKGGRR